MPSSDNWLRRSSLSDQQAVLFSLRSLFSCKAVHHNVSWPPRCRRRGEHVNTHVTVNSRLPAYPCCVVREA